MANALRAATREGSPATAASARSGAASGLAARGLPVAVRASGAGEPEARDAERAIDAPAPRAVSLDRDKDRNWVVAEKQKYYVDYLIQAGVHVSNSRIKPGITP